MRKLILRVVKGHKNATPVLVKVSNRICVKNPMVKLRTDTLTYSPIPIKNFNMKNKAIATIVNANTLCRNILCLNLTSISGNTLPNAEKNIAKTIFSIDGVNRKRAEPTPKIS